MSSDQHPPKVVATLRDEPTLFDAPMVGAPPAPQPKPRGPKWPPMPANVDAVDSPNPTPVGGCWCDRGRDPGGDWFEQLHRKRCDP